LANLPLAHLYYLLYSSPSKLSPIFVDDVEKKLWSRLGEELKSALRAITPILEVFEMLR
jgi:hypothetical protein